MVYANGELTSGFYKMSELPTNKTPPSAISDMYLPRNGQKIYLSIMNSTKYYSFENLTSSFKGGSNILNQTIIKRMTLCSNEIIGNLCFSKWSGNISRVTINETHWQINNLFYEANADSLLWLKYRDILLVAKWMGSSHRILAVIEKDGKVTKETILNESFGIKVLSWCSNEQNQIAIFDMNNNALLFATLI